MQIALNIFLLMLGFALLIQSAKIFVNASVGIATRLRVPTMVIGLTVVAMGTSAPEVVISVSAAIGGSSDLAIANAVGANLFNLLFIVGFCAMLYPITVQMADISRDYWVSVVATIVLLVMVIIFADNVIPRFGGLIFLVGFFTYMFIVVRHALRNKTEDAGEEDKDAASHFSTGKESLPVENQTNEKAANVMPLWKCIVLAVVGIAVIVGAGQLTVSSAVNIATSLGITERVIGLTIVSIGTSLPELVTTIIACRKKEGEFALGFIIGSSIFNIMFVLGLAGVVVPLTVERNVIFDIAVLTVGMLAFFLCAKSGKKLVRAEGLFLVLGYLGYMVWVVLL